MFSGIRIILFCLAQLVFLQSSAQLVLNTEHYSTEDGLADNRITVMTKDRDGYMWFGSWSGISRFDGYQFKTFKSYPGDNSPLKSNRIDEIVEDGAGQFLWVNAYDNCIYRFDKRSGTFLSLAQLLSDPSLEKIAFEKILAVDGPDIWFKTQSSGLLLLKNSASGKPRAIWFSQQSDAGHRINANQISTFHLDKQHHIWLASANGLNLLEAKKDGSYLIKKSGFPKGLTPTYFSDLNDGVLVGTSNGTLLKFNRSLQIIHQATISSKRINNILSSAQSRKVYITTAAGELFVSDQGVGMKMLFQTKDSSPLGYIHEDSTGSLWIGSPHYGVIRIAITTNRADYFYAEQNYQFVDGLRSFTAFEDRAGTVHINFDGQINSYHARSNKMELLRAGLSNYPRSKNNLRLYHDPAGVLWLSSGYEGVDKLIFQENPFTYLLPRPASPERESNEIRGLYADGAGKLWAGTKQGELFTIQQHKEIARLSVPDVNNNAGIYFIKGDRSGNTWMATKGNGIFYGNLGRPDQVKTGFSHYTADPANPNAISSNLIYCMLEDQSGKVWAGSFEEGLIQLSSLAGKTTFKTVNNSFKNYPKNGFRKIRHLAQDKNGLIWVGTTDGLLIFDPASGLANDYIFKTYKKESGNIKSLGGNDIQYIYPDSKGQVWVLTTTGGLNLAVGANPMKSLSFVNHSTKNGLPSDFLLSCIEDKYQNLWIATQNGLSKMSADRKRFQNFNQSDGLSSATFSESSCTRLPDGTLVFGTTGGILSFNPDAIHNLKISAPMAITNLQVNSKDMEIGNNKLPILLDHDENTLSIDFAVLDFHATDKQRYAYRLLGYDEVWRNAEGQRRVNFTKLPPGKYTFQVKSLNSELYRTIPFRSLELVIHPPFYRTWWAYVVYVLILAISILLLRRNALTMLKLRQRVAVEQQLAELKVDFFNQISHELRTPLTMIISPSEEIQQNERLTAKGKEYINVVLANAHRMLHLVNQVLNLRKVQSGKESLVKSEVEITSVIKELIFSFKETIDRRTLRIEMRAEQSLINGWVDRHKFEVIVYNLLGNAIKFSDDGAKILIVISTGDRPGYFSLAVIDEGSGVSNEELERIFSLYYQGSHLPKTGIKGTGIGLALSKELVDLHGGNIRAEHNNPKGLKIILELEQAITNHSYQYQGTDADRNQAEELISAASAKGTLPVLLIVEDNEDLQKFLKNKFSDVYQVETASDGEEGITKAKQLLPNLILSDIMMPKKDGIQLLDELKNDNSTSHIPVILLSARFSIESQIEGLKYGADYYLAKPFNFTLLKAAVDHILVRRKAVFQQIQDKEELRQDENVLTEYDRIFLSKLLDIVEGRLNDADFNIDDVAESLGMSRSTFYRKFKSLTDSSPVDFVRDTRLKKAKELFDAGETNISVVAYSVGFNSPKYFTLCFKNKYVETPSCYVKSVKTGRKKTTHL